MNTISAGKFSLCATWTVRLSEKEEAAESSLLPSFCFLYGLQSFMTLQPGNIWQEMAVYPLKGIGLSYTVVGAACRRLGAVTFAWCSFSKILVCFSFTRLRTINNCWEPNLSLRHTTTTTQVSHFVSFLFLFPWLVEISPMKFILQLCFCLTHVCCVM